MRPQSARSAVTLTQSFLLGRKPTRNPLGRRLVAVGEIVTQEVLERGGIQLPRILDQLQPLVREGDVPAHFADVLRPTRLFPDQLVQRGEARNQFGASDLAETLAI